MKKTEIKIAISRVIFAFVIFAFALVSYFGLSYGWFSKNNTVGAGGLSVRIESGSEITLTNRHAFLYGDNGVICLDASTPKSYEMLKYDAILTDKNLNTPLIFRIVAEGVSSDGDITVTVPRVSAVKKPVFTAVASVKVAFGLKINGLIEKDTYTANGTNGDNAKIFGGVRDLVKSTDNTNGNVVYGTFGNSNTISLTINSSDYKEYMCAVQNGVCDYDATSKNALVFYIAFDYDNDLMNAFLQTVDEKNDIKFYSDIGTITID